MRAPLLTGCTCRRLEPKALLLPYLKHGDCFWDVTAIWPDRPGGFLGPLPHLRPSAGGPTFPLSLSINIGGKRGHVLLASPSHFYTIALHTAPRRGPPVLKRKTGVN